MKQFKLKAQDGKEIVCYQWDDVKTPQGVLQLVHGSAEHSLRYDEFAKYLNKKGYIVVANDHRGHGKTANVEEGELGYFADENGWKIIIDDLKLVNDYIQDHFKELPICMLGHSMGSFMGRTYLIDYWDTIDSIILSGTAWYNPMVLKVGRNIAIKHQKKYGAKYVDEFIWKLSYKAFNKKYKNEGDTGSEWQTRDKDIQQDFLNDKLAGQHFTASGFKDMFDGLTYIQDKKNIAKTNKELPILLASGLGDPVGNYGKGVKKVFKVMKKQGLNVQMKLYPNFRHEILFELDHKVVFDDVVAWLKQTLKA